MMEASLRSLEERENPRSIHEIKEQLADLKNVWSEVAKYPADDFASQLSRENFKRHEAELLNELRAAQLLDSKADAEFSVDGEPVIRNDVAAGFLGTFLRTVQDVVNAIAQEKRGQATSRAAVPSDIVNQNKLLVMPEFQRGSFGVRVRFLTREELGLTYDAMASEVLDSLHGLLSDGSPSQEIAGSLTSPRVKSHYRKLVELLAKQDASLCFRTRNRPAGVTFSSRVARERMEWLDTLQETKEEITQTGILVGGSTERGRFELKVGDEIFAGTVTREAQRQLEQFHWNQQVTARINVLTLEHEEASTELSPRYEAVDFQTVESTDE